MTAVFMLGYDAWGDGGSVEEYLVGCRASPKYALGRWYVLVQADQIVSALICYTDAFNLPASVVGIGSVATRLDHRLKGYASSLVGKVMARVSTESPVDGYFLFSDVEPVVYEKMGFVRLPPQHQRYQGSVAMIRPALKSVESITVDGFSPPRYF